MAPSLNALSLMMETMSATEPWRRDPEVIPIPWRHNIMQDTLNRGKQIKLGLFWADGHMTPHPPVTRALRIVQNALKQAGFRVNR
jgi:amidase